MYFSKVRIDHVVLYWSNSRAAKKLHEAYNFIFKHGCKFKYNSAWLTYIINPLYKRHKNRLIDMV